MKTTAITIAIICAALSCGFASSDDIARIVSYGNMKDTENVEAGNKKQFLSDEHLVTYHGENKTGYMENMQYYKNAIPYDNSSRNSGGDSGGNNSNFSGNEMLLSVIRISDSGHDRLLRRNESVASRQMVDDESATNLDAANDTMKRDEWDYEEDLLQQARFSLANTSFGLRTIVDRGTGEHAKTVTTNLKRVIDLSYNETENPVDGESVSLSDETGRSRYDQMNYEAKAYQHPALSDASHFHRHHPVSYQASLLGAAPPPPSPAEASEAGHHPPRKKKQRRKKPYTDSYLYAYDLPLYDYGATHPPPEPSQQPGISDASQQPVQQLQEQEQLQYIGPWVPIYPPQRYIYQRFPPQMKQQQEQEQQPKHQEQHLLQQKYQEQLLPQQPQPQPQEYQQQQYEPQHEMEHYWPYDSVSPSSVTVTGHIQVVSPPPSLSGGRILKPFHCDPLKLLKLILGSRPCYRYVHV